MSKLTGRILLTGGAGTLGRAIIRKAYEEEWDCQFTVFSTDSLKHIKLKSEYPDVQCIAGDIRDPDALFMAMTGKDIVLHLAAVKHIPVSEYQSLDTIHVNILGSMNVCRAAMELGTPHVMGISTDKVAHPVNAYGATKYLMEKIFAEYARLGLSTSYHLVRYGNVLESNGSVIEVWKKALENGEPIKITNSGMTRFWLSPSQSAEIVTKAFQSYSGQIYIPKLPSLSIGKLAEYVLKVEPLPIQEIPLRPGEKIHEELLTSEEGWYAMDKGDHYLLSPTTTPRNDEPLPPFSSDKARRLTEKELMDLLKNE